MIALAQHHLVTLAVALLIGVVTAWWVFAPRNRRTDSHQDKDPIHR